MVFAIQDREALAGNSTKNPFTFHPFKSIQLFVNNKEYFPELLECDIKNDDYTLMFNQFNEALGYDKRGNCLINSENFKSHFMVPVALSSDRTINLHHNLQEVVDFKVLINLGPWTPMTSPMLSNIPHLYVNSASVKNTLPPKQQKFFNRGGISNLFFQSLC